MTNYASPIAFHPSNERLLDQGKQSGYLEGPPIMKLSYTYQHPFNTVCLGYLKKFDYESRL